jgi:thiol-disulfide isomerase/thioredoxin
MKTFIKFILPVLFLSLNISFAQAQQFSNSTAKGAITITGRFDSLKNGFKVRACPSSMLGNATDAKEYYLEADHHTFSLHLDSISCPIYLRSLNCWNMNQIYRDPSGKVTRDSMLARKFNPESDLTRIHVFRYLIEPGDSIEMAESDVLVNYAPLPGSYYHKLIFKGKGVEKYNCIQQLDINDVNFRRINPHSNRFSISNYRLIDSLANAQLGALEAYRSKLSPMAFTTLQGEIVGYYQLLKYTIFSNSELDLADKLDTLKGYVDPIANFIAERKYYSNGFIPYSFNFTGMIMEKYRIDSCLIPAKTFNFSHCYAYLKNNFSGPLREKLLTLLITDDHYLGETDLLEYIKETLMIASDPYLKNLLEQEKDGLISSLYHFDYYLTDTKGQKVSISGFKNKVVVMDFWYNGCGPCRELAPVLEKIERQFEGKNVVFLSVNTDNQERWIDALKGGKYSSSYAVNLNVGSAGRNHALLKHYLIQGYPTVLLFDKNGTKIQFNERLEDRERLLSEKIARLLQSKP